MPVVKEVKEAKVVKIKNGKPEKMMAKMRMRTNDHKFDKYLTPLYF